MKLDSTASSSTTCENAGFQLGTPSFGSASCRVKEEGECPSSWGYVYLHYKKTDKFEEEVRQLGLLNCFVHKSVLYKPRNGDHGVKKEVKPTVSGLVFLQGATHTLQAFLNEYFPLLYLVKDHTTNRPAVIPDVQMQPFMQIAKHDPTRIRILEKPIDQYIKGNVRLRVLTGPFKGREGYLIRIDRDRKLVMELGNMTIAISNVHREEFEEAE